jgi:hypothetical protein
MTSIVSRFRFLLFVLGAILLCLALYYGYYYSQPEIFATFWMESDASQIPGVKVQTIIDVSSMSEVEVYTFLEVENKNIVGLMNLTRESFTTDTGSIILTQIGACMISAINLNSWYVAQNFPAFYVKSVSELVAKYDEIYAELRRHDPDLKKPSCIPVPHTEHIWPYGRISEFLVSDAKFRSTKLPA